MNNSFDYSGRKWAQMCMHKTRNCIARIHSHIWMHCVKMSNGFLLLFLLKGTYKLRCRILEFEKCQENSERELWRMHVLQKKVYIRDAIRFIETCVFSISRANGRKKITIWLGNVERKLSKNYWKLLIYSCHCLISFQSWCINSCRKMDRNHFRLSSQQ